MPKNMRIEVKKRFGFSLFIATMRNQSLLIYVNIVKNKWLIYFLIYVENFIVHYYICVRAHVGMFIGDGYEYVEKNIYGMSFFIITLNINYW